MSFLYGMELADAKGNHNRAKGNHNRETLIPARISRIVYLELNCQPREITIIDSNAKSATERHLGANHNRRDLDTRTNQRDGGLPVRVPASGTSRRPHHFRPAGGQIKDARIFGEVRVATQPSIYVHHDIHMP